MKKVKTTYTFKRVEKKYLLTKDTYKKLLYELKDYMYVDDYGLTTICNIYYDTPNYDLARISIDKPLYKEKLRLRSYGIPKNEDDVFLEIKKKCNGTVFKRRVSMKENEVRKYFETGKKPICYNQILNEIDYFIKYYRPEPKLYLAYDRIAYFSKDNLDLRITFDHNIRVRDYDLDLTKGDYGENILGNSYYLMEIKVEEAIPIYLARILSKLNIYPVSYSKYGTAYKNSLSKKLELAYFA